MSTSPLSPWLPRQALSASFDTDSDDRSPLSPWLPRQALSASFDTDSDSCFSTSPSQPSPGEYRSLPPLNLPRQALGASFDTDSDGCLSISLLKSFSREYRSPPPPNLPTQAFDSSFNTDSDGTRSSPEKSLPPSQIPRELASSLLVSPEKPLRHTQPFGMNALTWIFQRHKRIGYDSGQVVTWVDSRPQSWKRFYSIQRSHRFHIFCVYSGKAHRKDETLLEGTFKTTRDVRAFSFREYEREHELKIEQYQDPQSLLLLKPKNRPNEEGSSPLDTIGFQQEMQFMEAFKDVPGILKLEDSFTYTSKKGRVKNCLIVEKYPNNLQELIASQSLTPRNIRDIQRKLLATLVKIHKRGFIHRDIKPENILLDEYLNPVFADFGLSVGPRQESHFAGGTPDYFAPEVAYAMYLKECLDQNDPGVTRKEVIDAFATATTPSMDVFSLGLIFLKMWDKLQYPFGHSVRERASLFPRSSPRLNPDIELGLNIHDYQLPNSWLGEMVALDPRNRASAKEAFDKMRRSHL